MSQTLTHFKTCSICRERKPLDAFTVFFTSRSRHTRYCRACISVANRGRYMARSQQMRERLKGFNKKLKDDKAERVSNYLREHPCVDCGEADPVVLEFDHVRGKKRYLISSLIKVGYSLQTLQNEIEKCDVVCANCHRRHPANQASRVR